MLDFHRLCIHDSSASMKAERQVFGHFLHKVMISLSLCLSAAGATGPISKSPVQISTGVLALSIPAFPGTVKGLEVSFSRPFWFSSTWHFSESSGSLEHTLHGSRKWRLGPGKHHTRAFNNSMKEGGQWSERK